MSCSGFAGALRIAHSLLVTAVLGALVLVAGCGRGGDRAELEEVPRPKLERVEPAVRKQLEERRAAVDTALADSADDRELAKTYGELGAAYQLYELREPAAAAYDNACRLAPDEARWFYLRALLEQDLGDLEAASADLDRVLALDRDYFPARVRKAEIDLLADRPQEAAETLEKALEEHPDSAAVFYGLGRARLATGDAAGAAEALERALELEPGADAAHYPLAIAYRKLGRVEEAATQMAARGETGPTLDDPWWAAVTAEATGAGLHLKRGGLAAVGGNSAAALEAYREAVAANPESAAAHQSLGSALAAQGDWLAAKTELEAALELDPENPVVHSNLGQTLSALGETQAAIQHLERAVELDPRRSEARLELASIYDRQGERTKALAQVEAVLETDPSDTAARGRQQQLLVALGRGSEVVSAARQAASAAPKSFGARFDLAAALAVAGDGEGAARALAEAFDLATDASERAQARFAQGQLAQGRGQPGEAERRYQEVLELAPDQDDARFLLAGLLGRRGRYADAARQFAVVREHHPERVAAWLGEATAQSLAGDLEGASHTLEQGVAAQPQGSAAALEMGHALARLLATSPGGDGARAVALAEPAFQAESSVTRGRTLAMAYAAASRFDEAITWQQRLLEEARRRGDRELEEALEADLEHYRRGERASLSRDDSERSAP
ncbi:MAG: tetratricopeptide repeat protein [Acidobacteria bacterium]|nr:tetratricopeptide repeat protein [Acidobacteriota bacterium]